VVVFGVYGAGGALYATGDLCGDAPLDGPNGELVNHNEFDNIIETVAVRCISRQGGEVVAEETRFNWIGVTTAIFFPIGVFFASAGILGLVDRRRAALITSACVVICFSMVVIFFA
jgi:hypothetical protein